MPVIEGFKNVKRKKIEPSRGIAGFDDLRRVSAFEIGTGNRAFKADSSGIWLGANAFADAPFSVDMEGNITASSLDLSGYLTKAGASQVLAGDIQVGVGNVKIDGANKRIVINDGTNDRILIGFQSGGF